MEEEVLDGFKVTDFDNCSVCILENGKVQYRQNEWAGPTPGNGPLAVFDDYQLAKQFATGMNMNKVWSCWWKPSSETKLWRHLVSDEVIQTDISELPNGTCFANSVMLIAEVKYDQKRREQS